MPRLSIWNQKKGNDYKFLDRIISEFFGTGTAAFIHLVAGVFSQATTTFNADGTTSPAVDPNNQTPTTTGNVTSIQDVLFLENRDVSYDPNVYEMRTIYNVGDSDFDLRQFGMFVQSDTKFLEFHLNDMIATIGRKLMSGDVIELPHQRDEFLLNQGPAINQFFVVQDASWASDGYSATWWQHIWRVKVSPMPASQEYSDILNQQATNPLGLPMTNANGSPATLGSLMSTMAADLGLNEAVVDDAVANFKKRYFETQQFWFCPGTTSETGTQNPWIFAGDGIPPNGAVLVGQGKNFPTAHSQGDYYLRTDYHPAVLFMWDTGKWKRQEVNWRGCEWSAASRLMKDFINSSRMVTQEDGEVTPEKVNMSKVVTRPNVDF